MRSPEELLKEIVRVMSGEKLKELVKRASKAGEGRFWLMIEIGLDKELVSKVLKVMNEKKLKELVEKAKKGRGGEFWQIIEEGLKDCLCPICAIQLKLESAHGYYRLECPECRGIFVVIEEYPHKPPISFDKDTLETIHDMFSRRRI